MNNKQMNEEEQLNQLDDFGDLGDLWRDDSVDEGFKIVSLDKIWRDTDNSDDEELLEQHSNVAERAKSLEDRYEMIIVQAVLLT